MNKLFFLAIFLIFGSCGDNDVKEKIIEKQVALVSKDSTGFIMSFYHTDSIQSNFNYYLKVKTELEQKESYYNSNLESKRSKMQNFLSKKEKEMAAQLLSENEIAQVKSKLQKMNEELIQFEQSEGIKLQQEMLIVTQQVNKKIEAFGKMFSEQNNIDVLLSFIPGQQINYINPNMDVSSAFVDFLNAEQKKLEKDL
jgi:Skp family chaperone for outer membrane proteins